MSKVWSPAAPSNMCDVVAATSLVERCVLALPALGGMPEMQGLSVSACSGESSLVAWQRALEVVAEVLCFSRHGEVICDAVVASGGGRAALLDLAARGAYALRAPRVTWRDGLGACGCESQGHKRVLQCRFNSSCSRSSVSEKAFTLRDLEER